MTVHKAIHIFPNFFAAKVPLLVSSDSIYITVEGGERTQLLDAINYYQIIALGWRSQRYTRITKR